MIGAAVVIGVATLRTQSSVPETSLTPQAVSQSHQRKIVLKGERHTSTNFMRTLLVASFGEAACSSEISTCTEGVVPPWWEGEPTAVFPWSIHPQHIFCGWKHGYIHTSCKW